ncbi:DUF1853 family protein [Salinivibrio sp. ES.052]|uniref:DUF1853 family protein n=1 Tax=Salinivibrio sp. ES.052 TaxID=1882823 RepID=UPI00092C2FEE|nr:DUF1853 family protein [Salinivibrio sp. ES.052]SIN94326.1 hypothetical protein SAMN05444724_1321 [Salinivibrio sp. ES.052]
MNEPRGHLIDIELFTNTAQIRADMQWLLTQAPLLSPHQFPMLPKTLWSNVPLPIPKPYSGPKRIGFYYQWLLTELINHHPQLRLEAEEIQVNEAGKTRGAIDFLIENQGHLEHWEVAVKFYLAYENRWLGPNAKDALDIKVTRMLDHQLALSSHPSFRQQYPHWQPTQKRLLVQGRLYRHYGYNIGLPDWSPVSTESIGGWWCWPEALPTDRAFGILARDQWLSLPPFSDLPKVAANTLNEITRAHHLLDETQTPWFVVPKGWPNNVPPLPPMA